MMVTNDELREHLESIHVDVRQYESDIARKDTDDNWRGDGEALHRAIETRFQSVETTLRRLLKEIPNPLDATWLEEAESEIDEHRSDLNNLIDKFGAVAEGADEQANRYGSVVDELGDHSEHLLAYHDSLATNAAIGVFKSQRELWRNYALSTGEVLEWLHRLETHMEELIMTIEQAQEDLKE